MYICALTHVYVYRDVCVHSCNCWHLLVRPKTITTYRHDAQFPNCRVSGKFDVGWAIFWTFKVSMCISDFLLTSCLSPTPSTNWITNLGFRMYTYTYVYMYRYTYTRTYMYTEMRWLLFAFWLSLVVSLFCFSVRVFSVFAIWHVFCLCCGNAFWHPEGMGSRRDRWSMRSTRSPKWHPQFAKMTAKMTHSWSQTHENSDTHVMPERRPNAPTMSPQWYPEKRSKRCVKIHKSPGVWPPKWHNLKWGQNCAVHSQIWTNLFFGLSKCGCLETKQTWQTNPS